MRLVLLRAYIVPPLVRPNTQSLHRAVLHPAVSGCECGVNPRLGCSSCLLRERRSSPSCYSHLAIPNNCYVDAQMRLRKPGWKQTGFSRTCLLCNSPFCDAHKGKEQGVCETNHFTYCGKQEHIDRHAPVQIFVSLEARRKALGEES